MFRDSTESTCGLFLFFWPALLTLRPFFTPNSTGREQAVRPLREQAGAFRDEVVPQLLFGSTDDRRATRPRELSGEKTAAARVV